MSIDVLSILKGLFNIFIKFLPFILIFVIFILIILCIKLKVKIKFKTFLKKGFRPKRGQFGLYCYCGKQGKGKTYSIVEYMLDNRNKCVFYSNIGNIIGVNFTHFVGFEGLISLKHQLDNGTLVYDKKKQLVFIYDEIFTELQKGSKLSKEVLDFLCQMRKRKIIFLTTAQEWAEIPLSFRRFCRYEIDCNMISFLGLGILIKQFKDAEQMKWSNDDQEFIAPIVDTTITKARKNVANSYDTFLRISSVIDYSKARVVTSPKSNNDVIDSI